MPRPKRTEPALLVNFRLELRYLDILAEIQLARKCTRTDALKWAVEEAGKKVRKKSKNLSNCT